VAADVATKHVVTVDWADTLQIALDKMASINVDELPVVRTEKPEEIVTIISKRDIVDYYYGRTQT
jgi:CIC family chloride channel protein